MIITGHQFRRGRILASLEQADLARCADVAPALVARVEATDGMAMIRKRDSDAIQRALKAAGVEIIPENGGGAGVRLRKVEL